MMLLSLAVIADGINDTLAGEGSDVRVKNLKALKDDKIVCDVEGSERFTKFQFSTVNGYTSPQYIVDQLIYW